MAKRYTIKLQGDEAILECDAWVPIPGAEGMVGIRMLSIEYGMNGSIMGHTIFTIFGSGIMIEDCLPTETIEEFLEGLNKWNKSQESANESDPKSIEGYR
jgi:hypothetical protein